MSSIAFTKNTISALENFAQINKACFLEAGNVIRTTSQSKTVLAIVKIEETIPSDFKIYDLPGLITMLNLPIFDSCNIDIDEKRMIIKNDRAEQKFVAAAESIVSLPPASFEPKLSEVKFKGSLTTESLSHIMKVVSAMKHDTIRFQCSGNVLKLVTLNSADPDTSNVHQYNIGTSQAGDFFVDIRPSNLKLIDIDYNFEVGLFAGNKTALLLKSQDANETITYLIGGEISQ